LQKSKNYVFANIHHFPFDLYWNYKKYKKPLNFSLLAVFLVFKCKTELKTG
jgi:hypothetical protein